ncbi:MAG TPA: hypothetical protein VF669_10235 [Tepidisphaeraceae bacterium]|jgi:hypothetical protein
MRMSLQWGVRVAFCFCCVTVQTVRAAIPVTQSTYTQSRFAKSLHQFNRRTLVEAYKEVGNRNPKWDDDAVKFLDAMSRHFTNAAQHSINRIQPLDDPRQLLEQGAQLLAKGCDDPMIAYCRAVTLWDVKHADEAKPIIEKTAHDLMESRYPLNRAMAAAHRAFEMATTSRGADLAWAKYRDSVLAILSTWQFQDVDRRIFWTFISGYLEKDPIDRQKDLIDSAHELKNADPWLLGMITGRYRIHNGWEARGTGVAGTVTQDGWRVFYQELEKARDEFTAAWKLRPDYPEAAADMITVAMAVGPHIGEDQRKWFDRAVAAQPDYQSIYDQYFNALLPRWGGSYPQMYNLGLEGAQTERYDTLLPWQLVDAAERIAKDTGSYQYYSVPGVYDKVTGVLQTYAKRSPTTRDANWFRSYEAALAWRTAHYDEARKILDQVGQDVHEETFARWNTLPKLAIGHAYAMSSPIAATLQEAEKSAAAGKYDDALAKYKEISQKLPPTDRAHQFTNSRTKQLDWLKQFDSGNWVDLQPDKEMTGWSSIRGSWHVAKDRALAAVNEGWGLQAACDVTTFGTKFDMEATIEWPDDEKLVPAAAGIALSPPGFSGYWGVWLKKHDGKIFIVNDLVDGHEVETTADLKTNVLRLSMWDDNLTAFVNGKQVAQTSGVSAWFPASRIYLGIGGRTNPPDAQVRITQIRIKKLSE